MVWCAGSHWLTGDHNRLGFEEGFQPIQAILPANTGLLEAAKRRKRVDGAAVDQHATGVKLQGDLCARATSVENT